VKEAGTFVSADLGSSSDYSNEFHTMMDVEL